jgi:hypothetical protein
MSLATACRPSILPWGSSYFSIKMFKSTLPAISTEESLTKLLANNSREPEPFLKEENFAMLSKKPGRPALS